VLVPDGSPQSYRQESLPLSGDREGINDFSVRSVFAADADGDGLPELCVLSSVHEIGTRGPDYYSTDIYKWAGKGFIQGEREVEERLYRLPNAKAVRARLKKMLLNHPAGTTKAVR
jgi:hypothetical protein